jgi:hypothetical protein
MSRSIYCAYHIFTRILDSRDRYAPFYNLILEHGHIVFDLTENEYAISQQETITMFTRETGITTDTLPGYLEQLPFTARTGAGSALFILEEEQQDYAKALRSYGVCVVFLEHPESLDILQSSFYWQLEKPSRYENSDVASWHNIVEKAGRLPLNALALVDNYMFKISDTEKDSARSASNILSMLLALMPSRQNSALPFQILLVVASKETNANESRVAELQEKLDKVQSSLLTELTRKVRYKVELGIILHSNYRSDFHRRAIISNYHFLRFDHGLDAFDRNRIRTHNDISIEGAFRNLGKPKCHTPWKSMALELQSIKKVLSESAGFLTTGACENRLLDLVPAPPPLQSTHNPYQRDRRSVSNLTFQY